MSFDPSCLPALPTCPDDIVEWSKGLVACLSTNFAQAFTQINRIAVPTFNICAQLANLGPGCYVTPTGIDQTQFVYATDDSQVVAGNGYLPVPPQPTTINYRAGAIILELGNECDAETQVTWSPPLPAWGYAVLLTLGNLAACTLYAGQPSDANGVRVGARRLDCSDEDNMSVWIYWLAIQYS